MKIAIVAGEHSGDVLGVGLIESLKEKYPDAHFYGIGGPKMLAAGFESLYPMHRLSVFGLFEVLKHLPGLLRLRSALTDTLLQNKPDVFIGIDAPDFNLKLERTLHEHGIKTIHYVSPTVWAWRPKRIKKLIGSLDALLCIFPFEKTYFKDKQVPAYYIGHPLADKLGRIKRSKNPRLQFELSEQDTVLALMPGSRLGEIERHASVFIQAAKQCEKHFPDLKVIVPMPDERTKEAFNQCYQKLGLSLNILVSVTSSDEIILASDAVLVASGTATLEIMLLNKPMVVAYKLSSLTAWVIRTFSLLKIEFVSMPNLIANKQVVSEFLQEYAEPNKLSKELIPLLSNSDTAHNMLTQFDEMKDQLMCNANQQAAKVVSNVIEGRLE